MFNDCVRIGCPPQRICGLASCCSCILGDLSHSLDYSRIVLAESGRSVQRPSGLSPPRRRPLLACSALRAWWQPSKTFFDVSHREHCRECVRRAGDASHPHTELGRRSARRRRCGSWANPGLCRQRPQRRGRMAAALVLGCSRRPSDRRLAISAPSLLRDRYASELSPITASLTGSHYGACDRRRHVRPPQPAALAEVIIRRLRFRLAISASAAMSPDDVGMSAAMRTSSPSSVERASRRSPRSFDSAAGQPWSSAFILARDQGYELAS